MDAERTVAPEPSADAPALPGSLRSRTVRRLFAIAGSGHVGAWAAAFATAVVCGVAERWVWLPEPVGLPLSVLVPGLLMALIASLPLRRAAALAVGAWCGDFAGLLFPGAGPAAAGLTRDVAFGLATANAVGGLVAGVLTNVAFATLRPRLDRRFMVAFPCSALGTMIGAIAAVPLLPNGIDAARLWFSVGLSQGLGMLVVGTTLNVWWLHAHGVELLARSSRGALAVVVALLGLLLVAMHESWLGLNVPTYALLMGSTLVAAGLRFPLRTSAPLTSAAYLATMAVFVSDSGPALPWLGDLEMVIALQAGLVFAITCIFMQSAGFTARLLFEQRLHQYARQLEFAEDDHRRVAASTVREGVSQSLAGVRFALSALNNIGLPPNARQSLDESLDMLRSAERDAELAHRELGPVGLDEHGIAPVLESYLRRLSQSTDVELALDARGALDTVSPRTRHLAFRIVSELVGNAVRERIARRLHVAVEATPDALRLVVRDVGGAFALAPTSLAPHSQSRLAMLRERVLLEGGELRAGAANDDGTAVHVTLPMRRA
jgi:signal transduction histidine kinase